MVSEGSSASGESPLFEVYDRNGSLVLTVSMDGQQASDVIACSDLSVAMKMAGGTTLNLSDLTSREETVDPMRPIDRADRRAG
ncbi:hypothetical protein EU513_00350 [Yimella sp. RIT 621]|uniref:hypothetical protein n=1 Tax=Yimella sp. RIT 621 TaxID=2510323 RepID=UPI0010A972D1|nr:hypothetical protein [Yimella sp. RIT 621]RYG78795.1 hypothetical protein EU513_00350 [Yimella sp. RIT 621]